MSQPLKLVEFQTLYRVWRLGIPWWDHLLLGVLVWLEERVIQQRVTTTVDEAIDTYQTLQEPPLPDLITPVITETPSKTSTSLPELRITAPWYKETKE